MFSFFIVNALAVPFEISRVGAEKPPFARFLFVYVCSERESERGEERNLRLISREIFISPEALNQEQTLGALSLSLSQLMCLPASNK